jgi:hypothetical protein
MISINDEAGDVGSHAGSWSSSTGSGEELIEMGVWPRFLLFVEVDSDEKPCAWPCCVASNSILNEVVGRSCGPGGVMMSWQQRGIRRMPEPASAFPDHTSFVPALSRVVPSSPSLAHKRDPAEVSEVSKVSEVSEVPWIYDWVERMMYRCECLPWLSQLRSNYSVIQVPIRLFETVPSDDCS